MYKSMGIAILSTVLMAGMAMAEDLKIEGGEEVLELVEHLTKHGVPVMGHVGLLPQTSINYKVKGKNLFQKKKILEDAVALSDAGVFAIVIECVVESLAKKITSTVPVPTIGIGASRYCDGQILVTDDIIGLTDFHPKFVKKYSNLKIGIEDAVKKYCEDVKKRKFPSFQHVYKFQNKQ